MIRSTGASMGSIRWFPLIIRIRSESPSLSITLLESFTLSGSCSIPIPSSPAPRNSVLASFNIIGKVCEVLERLPRVTAPQYGVCLFDLQFRGVAISESGDHVKRRIESGTGQNRLRDRVCVGIRRATKTRCDLFMHI